MDEQDKSGLMPIAFLPAAVRANGDIMEQVGFFQP